MTVDTRKAKKLIRKAAIREWLLYDLGLLRTPVAILVYAAGVTLTKLPKTAFKIRGFKMLMRLHSSGWSPGLERRIAARIQKASIEERAGLSTGLSATYDQLITEAVRAQRSKTSPTRIPGARLLVVKSATDSERGVIVIDYSYVFPMVAGLYDLDRMAERYDIVLEPSWAGVCTPDILMYTRLNRPVYVQTVEPKDRNFIEQLNSNLRVVQIAANWWADASGPPRPGERDIDVAMVAAWSDIKRHWRFFRALKTLAERGHTLKAALVGYRYDRSLDDIASLAAHYGVAEQVQLHERITPAEVAGLLARSKVHVLWSRRECANRAIVESMLADTPVIVRHGLTYGFPYPYINQQTGRFVREHELPEAILTMIRERNRYSPRDWVLANMTNVQATAILESRLRADAIAEGRPWTRGLTMKTSALDSQAYQNPADGERFWADYEFIAGCVRT